MVTTPYGFFIYVGETSTVSSIYLEKVSDGYMLGSLITKPAERRKGYATQVMQKVVDFADKYNSTLTLIADGDIPQDALENFYGSFGFVKDGCIMRRPPKPVPN